MPFYIPSCSLPFCLLLSLSHLSFNGLVFCIWGLRTDSECINRFPQDCTANLFNNNNNQSVFRKTNPIYTTLTYDQFNKNKVSSGRSSVLLLARNTDFHIVKLALRIFTLFLSILVIYAVRNRLWKLKLSVVVVELGVITYDIYCLLNQP